MTKFCEIEIIHAGFPSCKLSLNLLLFSAIYITIYLLYDIYSFDLGDILGQNLVSLEDPGYSVEPMIARKNHDITVQRLQAEQNNLHNDPAKKLLTQWPSRFQCCQVAITILLHGDCESVTC